MRWILDPIDGTRSFIHGVPLWGTLMAIQHDNDIVGGLAYMPALGELVFAAPCIGVNTRWNQSFDRVASPSLDAGKAGKVDDSAKQLDQAMFCHTSPEYFVASDCLHLHDRLLQRCASTRAWSDCYAFVLLATGRVHVVVEPKLNLWDIAAFIPIIEGSGGKIARFDGRQMSTDRETSVFACSKELYDETLSLIADEGCAEI